MKYSNYIGVLAAIALIIFCFVPWVYIAYINTTITGLSAEHTNFGRPGVMHILLAVFAIPLFFTNKVWSVRANLFIVTFNFAWSIRNFFLITQCQSGECPEKKLGIYAILVSSFLILLMGLLPKTPVQK